MDIVKRTSVSSHELQDLVQAVERANLLNGDSGQSYLQDPCRMLEALCEVYAASRRLVQESGQWSQGLASGTPT